MPVGPDFRFSEYAEKRKSAQALGLFQQLFEEFGIQSFTLQDLIDSFNVLSERFGSSGDSAIPTNHGRAGLDYLVLQDVLLFDSQTRTYQINLSSPYVLSQFLPAD